jgi:hypothetical protein
MTSISRGCRVKLDYGPRGYSLLFNNACEGGVGRSDDRAKADAAEVGADTRSYIRTARKRGTAAERSRHTQPRHDVARHGRQDRDVRRGPLVVPSGTIQSWLARAGCETVRAQPEAHSHDVGHIQLGWSLSAQRSRARQEQVHRGLQSTLVSIVPLIAESAAGGIDTRLASMKTF